MRPRGCKTPCTHLIFRAISLGPKTNILHRTKVLAICIEKGLALLYSDKDFDPFVEHLGLRTALSEAIGIFPPRHLNHL